MKKFWLAVVSALCTVLMASTPLRASAAQTFHQLSAADDAAIRKDANSTPATGLPVACNQATEEAIRAQLRMWGRDEKSFPAVYRTLETLKANKWQFPNMTSTGKPGRYGMTHAPDDYAIVHVGSTTPQQFRNVTALSFSSMFVSNSDFDKYEIQTINVYTKDIAGNANVLIAAGTNDPDKPMTNMPVVAESRTAPQDNNPYQLDVIAYTTYVGEAANQPFCWVVRMDRGSFAGPMSVDVLDPTIAEGHKPPTKPDVRDKTVICLNRAVADTSGGEFCDYGPSQPGVLNENLDLLFPFAGTITTANPIYTMTWNGRTIPAVPDGTGQKPGILRIKLVRMEGGACDASIDVDHWQGFYVLNNKLSWQFSTPNDRKDSSKYLSAGKLSNCTDLDYTDVQDWYMIAMFYDTKKGEPFNPVSVGLGSLQSFTGYDINKQLMPVGYQWGCVIEGTLVTLADGRTVPIETLKTGDLLSGPSGRNVRLSAISPGRDNKFIKLVDAAGASVVVTRDHPVLTANGMRRARDLRTGDTVYGRNGPSILREVSADNRNVPATVYSVHLAAVDGGRIPDTKDQAFYAGGILVGDYTAQGAVMRQAADDRKQGKKQ